MQHPNFNGADEPLRLVTSGVGDQEQPDDVVTSVWIEDQLLFACLFAFAHICLIAEQHEPMRGS